MRSHNIVTYLLILMGVSAMPHTGSNLVRSQAAGTTPRAVYFMTNTNNGNSVVALRVAADGTLSEGSRTATGGKGGILISPSSGKPVAQDALASQGSIRIAGNVLFAVNAGSNTISMFNIDQTDPTKLTLVGQPASTRGDFPNTIAVSLNSKQVCAGNTGARTGISCGTFDIQSGIGPMDALRPYNLGQSNPPKGPDNTISSIYFSEAQDWLFANIKGNGTSNNVNGFVSAYKVSNGVVATKDVRSSPKGTSRLFGATTIPGTTDIVTSDSSFGGAILSVDTSGNVQTKIKTVVDNNKATCWASYSQKTGTAFLTDAQINELLEMDVTSGAITKMQLTTSNIGMTELNNMGNFVYALAPGNFNVPNVPVAIAVFDVSGGKGKAKQIQNFNPTGVTNSVEGMAVFG